MGGLEVVKVRGYAVGFEPTDARRTSFPAPRRRAALNHSATQTLSKKRPRRSEASFNREEAEQVESEVRQPLDVL